MTSINSNHSNLNLNLNLTDIASFNLKQVNPHLAFVFPGQGSQSINMLSGFKNSPFELIVQQTLAEANDVLGYDLKQIIETGPTDALNATTHTQVAILTASIAIWRIWQSAIRMHAQGIAAQTFSPAFVAGHSLGEYSALCASGVLDFASCLQLVKFRANQMQDAVPIGVGAMAAILGLDDACVSDVCKHITLKNAQNAKKSNTGSAELVEAVNFNTAGQVVIAGHKNAVEQAINALKAQGAKRAVLLNVSAPFHTTLMQTVADQLLAYVQNMPFSIASASNHQAYVVQNLNADIQLTEDAFKHALAQQAAAPVLWTHSMQRLQALGVRYVVECGTGKVLHGLNKRLENITSHTLADEAALMETLSALSASVPVQSSISETLAVMS